MISVKSCHMKTLLVQCGRVVVCHKLYLPVRADNMKIGVKCHLNRKKNDEILLKIKNWTGVGNINLHFSFRSEKDDTKEEKLG